MSKSKSISLTAETAKGIARLLGKYESLTCTGCEGQTHEEICPAREAFQLRNVLTQSINNPDKAHSN